MRVMSFTSIEDLNAFLAGEGVGKEATDSISEAIRDAMDGKQEQVSEPITEEVNQQIDLGNFDAYVEVTSNKISVLIKERQILEDMLNKERQSHVECHEHFEEHLHEMRLRGYMESIAAGLFPMEDFDSLADTIKHGIHNQAMNSMARMDEIRNKNRR